MNPQSFILIATGNSKWSIVILEKINVTLAFVGQRYHQGWKEKNKSTLVLYEIYIKKQRLPGQGVMESENQ